MLANADAATFNLLRRGWFIPSDNIEGIAADYPEHRPGTSSTTTSLGPTPRLTGKGPSRFCTRWVERWRPKALVVELVWEANTGCRRVTDARSGRLPLILMRSREACCLM